MRRRFATLDVFTNRRFAGNPLAVVLDPEGLDTAAMQTIAREFGHPETVFVFPPEDPAHRARVRIFTPGRELPFAGHPTVGTAVLLGLRDGAAAGDEIVLEEPIGPVRCTLERSETDRATRASPFRNCRPRPAPRRTTRRSQRRSGSRRPRSASTPSARRAGLPAIPSPSCRSPALPSSHAAVRTLALSTPPSAPAGRPTSSAARPPSRATRSTPACSRRRMASRKIPPPARQPPPLPVCSPPIRATAPTPS